MQQFIAKKLNQVLAVVLTIVALMTGQTAWAQNPATIGSISYDSTLGAYEIANENNLHDLAVYVNGTTPTAPRTPTRPSVVAQRPSKVLSTVVAIPSAASVSIGPVRTTRLSIFLGYSGKTKGLCGTSRFPMHELQAAK